MGLADLFSRKFHTVCTPLCSHGRITANVIGLTHSVIPFACVMYGNQQLQIGCM